MKSNNIFTSKHEIYHLHEWMGIVKEMISSNTPITEIREFSTKHSYIEPQIMQFFELAYSPIDYFEHVRAAGPVTYTPDRNHPDRALMYFDAFIKELHYYMPDSNMKPMKQRIKWCSGLDCMCAKDSELFVKLLNNEFTDPLITISFLKLLFFDIRLK